MAAAPAVPYVETPRWRAWGFSVQGPARPRQEDRLVLAPHPRADGSVLAAVLDGVGGHPRGAEAAEACARALREHHGPLADLVPRLNELALAAGGFTTVSAFLGDPDGAGGMLLQVGDSPAYIVGGSGPRTPPEFPPDEPSPYLTDFLGGPSVPRVNLARVRFEAGERVLLCTDGVRTALPSGELAAAVAQGHEEAVHSLRRQVLRAGAPDNATAVIVAPAAGSRP